MNDRYVSNSTLDEIAARLLPASRVILTSHAKPDGDAVGSTVALALALKHQGVETQLWYMPPVPAMFLRLFEGLDMRIADGSTLPDSTYDGLIVILDTGAWSQLSHLRDWLSSRAEQAIVLDHHIEGDAAVASMRYIDPTAAATAEIVTDLIKRLRGVIDQRCAEALYLGIASDTGWFRYSNVTARTFGYAAELLQCGARHSAIFDMSEAQYSKSHIRLTARALNSLEFALNDRLAIMTLTQDDYRECQASIEDGHGFADLPQRIGTVSVSCLLAQNHADHVKLSLRSKAGDEAVDVNELAKRFNGGGHARASGARFAGSLDEAKLALIQAVAHMLGEG